MNCVCLQKWYCSHGWLGVKYSGSNNSQSVLLQWNRVLPHFFRYQVPALLQVIYPATWFPPTSLAAGAVPVDQKFCLTCWPNVLPCLLTKHFALPVDQTFCLTCWPKVLPYLLNKHFASPVDQRFCFTWLMLQTHCMPCGVWPNFIFLQCVNLLAILHLPLLPQVQSHANFELHFPLTCHSTGD